MADPLVSVVIATYNMGQYISSAIESVLDQTWSAVEVIVVDDGSSDDTEQRVQPYLSRSNLRYIKTENRGQPKAKNRGIHEAKGEFIAFCDADDLWAKEKLALQIPHFKDDKVGVVYSDVSYIDEHGQSLEKELPYPTHSGYVTKQLALKNFVPFGTAVIRRRCIEELGAFDEQFQMGIDWDLWLRYSLQWKFHFLPERTYIYRIWSGQMSGNYRGRYDHAERILAHFIRSFPEALSFRDQRRVWSDTYLGRANHIRVHERLYIEPLLLMLKAFIQDPFYLPVWKSMLKLALFNYGAQAARSGWKQRVLNAAKRFGFLNISQWLTRREPRILMYHRVTDDVDVPGVGLSEFDEQMEYIAKHFDVISLEELLDRKTSGSSISNVLVLTFDDGYEDFVLNAYPVLQKHGFPASLFVATSFTSGRCWLWPDQIRYVLFNTEQVAVRLESMGKTIQLGDKPIAWDIVASHCKQLAKTEREVVVNEIADKCGVILPSEPPAKYRAASWDQLKGLKDISIGSHTREHEWLPGLSDDILWDELVESKEEIQNQLSRGVSALCYPFGGSADYGPREKKASFNAGYSYAVAAHASAEPLSDTYAVKRLAVSNNMYEFYKAVSGLGFRARRKQEGQSSGKHAEVLS